MDAAVRLPGPSPTPAVELTSAAATERDLLSRARAGDRQAQAVLYEQYIYGSTAIRGLLRRAVADETQREDLLQEIFLAATGTEGEFRGDSRLATYLYRVAQITVLEQYRAANTKKRGGHVRFIQESALAEDQGRELRCAPLEFEEVETRLALDKMMAMVPEAYREALRLRIVEDVDYQQIAERLSIPVNTVGTRIFKGKAVLVKLLKTAGFQVNDPPAHATHETT